MDGTVVEIVAVIVGGGVVGLDFDAAINVAILGPQVKALGFVESFLLWGGGVPLFIALIKLFNATKSALFNTPFPLPTLSRSAAFAHGILFGLFRFDETTL